MTCDHLWTAWLTVRKVLGGIVFITFARTCVRCDRQQDASGEILERAA